MNGGGRTTRQHAAGYIWLKGDNIMKKIFAIIAMLFLFAGNVWAADLTIKATEEMVGSGHATKADTLNRLSLVEHNTDGTHKILSGHIVQAVNYSTSAVATGTTVMPFDDTKPQKTEGDQYLTVSITPKSASNYLLILVNAYGGHSAALVYCTIALFQDDTADALAAQGWFTSESQGAVPVGINLVHKMTAGTTSETTFKVRIGGAQGGTFTFNGYNGARLYGGVSVSSITVLEIGA